MPMSEKTYTPLLPYDESFGENFTIYYPVAYSHNINLIPPEKIAMESGNVIKYYRCTNQEPILVGGK